MDFDAFPIPKGTHAHGIDSDAPQKSFKVIYGRKKVFLGACCFLALYDRIFLDLGVISSTNLKTHLS